MQAMDLGLSGKIAVVTGSSRGLGLASARALAAEGCHVVLCARSRVSLDAAVHLIAETAGRATPRWRIVCVNDVAHLGALADRVPAAQE